MAITADFHLHSNFSGDSDAPMKEMIEMGIQSGLKTMCFTEHMDLDFPYSEATGNISFEVNTDSYLYELIKNKELYKDKINVLFGIELGLQPQIAKINAKYIKEYDFDFVIGSSHISNGIDPYDPAFYLGRSVDQAYEAYFLSILENIKTFTNFDVYGHLDYVVRYGPTKDQDYSYLKYKDIFDEILEKLIYNGKGIEINTAGLSKGLKDIHPTSAIIKRYRELGGEIITVGSDAHTPGKLTQNFKRAEEALLASGFDYYTIFEKRMPKMIKL